MINLLKNSAEAIGELENKEEKGIIKVSITDDVEALNIIIEDNGVGFKGGEISKMLDPYVTTKLQGTGLGLSIVRKIVEDHKGLINIENIKPHGAKVTVSFLHTL
jgi:two-component system nitrogen regulation sensor histidine kinase NtrY